jgi:hypothetical protein
VVIFSKLVIDCLKCAEVGALFAPCPAKVITMSPDRKGKPREFRVMTPTAAPPRAAGFDELLGTFVEAADADWVG